MIAHFSHHVGAEEILYPLVLVLCRAPHPDTLSITMSVTGEGLEVSLRSTMCCVSVCILEETVTRSRCLALTGEGLEVPCHGYVCLRGKLRQTVCCIVTSPPEPPAQTST